LQSWKLDVAGPRACQYSLGVGGMGRGRRKASETTCQGRALGRGGLAGQGQKKMCSKKKKKENMGVSTSGFGEKKTQGVKILETVRGGGGVRGVGNRLHRDGVRWGRGRVCTKQRIYCLTRREGMVGEGRDGPPVQPSQKTGKNCADL